MKYNALLIRTRSLLESVSNPNPKKLNTVDPLVWTQLNVDIGLNLHCFTPEEQQTLLGTLECLSRALSSIEALIFKRRYGS